MKSLTLFIIASALSVNCFAANTAPKMEFDCGIVDGKNVGFEFQKNEKNTDGGFADYTGQYGVGVDKKDSKKGSWIQLKGYVDRVDGFGKAYVLMNEQREFTLYVEYNNTFSKGQKIRVVSADVKKNEDYEMICQHE